MSNLKKQTITKALRDMFSHIDDIKLLIADRGSENRDIKNIQRVLNTRVVFCDPGAPYQKGLVENTNRIFRRFLPKRTSFKNLPVIGFYRSFSDHYLPLSMTELTFSIQSSMAIYLPYSLKMMKV